MMNAKKITLIGTLSSIGAILRIPFAVIPSLQPTTFIVAVSGYVFGMRVGVTVGVLSALISNLLLGQGIWTFWQMFAWGLVGLSFGILGHITDKDLKNTLTKWIFAGLLFIWGYLFGWIMNLWHWLSTSSVYNIGTFLGINSMSLPFDTTHAIGNFFFAMLFGADFITILKRYKSKISYSYK
jgi:energy-coupling factor transport system substrate-specific component